MMEPGAGNGTVSLTQEWTNCGIPGGSKAYAPRRRLAVGTIWTQNGWHSSKSWLSHCSGHQASLKKWLWLKIMLGQKRAIWNVVNVWFSQFSLDQKSNTLNQVKSVLWGFERPLSTLWSAIPKAFNPTTFESQMYDSWQRPIFNA